MNLKPKKSLGQHFLNSPVVLKQIIESAHIQIGENVLEIGPGTGVLTKALLEAGANVIAIEKDSRAIELLKERFASELNASRLTLVEGDILDRESYSISRLIANDCKPPVIPANPVVIPAQAGIQGQTTEIESSDTLDSRFHGNDKAFQFSISNSSYAIVSNIPYYITGAILESFLEHEPRPNRMVLLVQKEVAERIIGTRTQRSDLGVIRAEVRPLSGKESILSISVKAFGTPKIIARVPRGAFTPPPTVDSAILSIENISDKRFKEKGVEIPRFFEIVKAGFAHKRKLLIRNLEAVVGKEAITKGIANGITAKERLEKVWFDLNLNEKARAEEVELGKWFEIVSNLRI